MSLIFGLIISATSTIPVVFIITTTIVCLFAPFIYAVYAHKNSK
jgi:hypothetical protein